MKLLTTLAALTMSAAAMTAAEPEPRFFNPSQEARVKSLEDRVAALEAQPARPQVAPASALPANYRDFLADVTGGAPGLLYVGRQRPAHVGEYRITCVVASLPGVAPGVYQCDLIDGVPSMSRRVEASAAQTAPAFATPVRDAVFQFVTPSACAGGQCPTPRRSYR